MPRKKDSRRLGEITLKLLAYFELQWVADCFGVRS